MSLVRITPDPKRVAHESLTRALILDDIKEVKRLLQQGLDLNAENHLGWSLLTVASNYGRAQSVRLLIDNGADVNKAGRWGVTPLMRAACRGDLEIARLLIENGADTDPRDISDFSALDYAESRDRKEMAQLLLHEVPALQRLHVVRKQQKLKALAIKPVTIPRPQP